MAELDMSDRTRVSVDAMRTLMERLFIRVGVPAEDAATAVEVLAFSDVHGIDSHGIPRMRMYLNAIAAGRVNLHPKITTVMEGPATLTLDGDQGLGLVVGPFAMRRAIEKAKESGWCTVSVRASNHLGTLAYYPMLAVYQGLGGMSMTNAGPLMVPTFGTIPVLGTNPFSIGFPGGDNSDPFLLDIASTSVAWGKVEIAKREGLPIPNRWAVDKNGAFTTDPNTAVALAPLGSDYAGRSQKGYGLAVMVDCFTAMLSGGTWSMRIPGRGIGTHDHPGTCHCFMAWRIDAFTDLATYRAQMDDMMATLRATPPAPDHDAVLAPGQPEFDAYRDRSVNGVPLHRSVRDDIRALAAEYDVPYDLG
ncbi:MAG: Ldh family oxidoreductase [Thermomicrobiales bacterium]